jgi:hypothetical protein
VGRVQPLTSLYALSMIWAMKVSDITEKILPKNPILRLLTVLLFGALLFFLFGIVVWILYSLTL